MKNQRKTEIKVGITVLMGVVIFLWILGWAKNLSLTSSEQSVNVLFENVDGLEVGDDVTVNGVRKGFVDNFNIEGESVLVKLMIDRDVNLKKDAKFAIKMLDLMGGKKVEVSPGTSNENLNIAKVQTGIFYADIPEVMSMLGGAQNDLFKVLDDVKITLSSLNKYLTDEQVHSDLKATLSNLSLVTGKLNVMIDENRKNVNELVSNSAELSSEAKNFIKENKDDIKNSVLSLQTILTKTDSLLNTINSFANEIKSKENNVGKLLYDKNLYNNLNESLNQLNELTKILVEQLKNDGIKVDAYIF